MAKPPTIADLTWLGDLRFHATSAHSSMTLDSSGLAGPSPVEALAFALAGCMSMDVVFILTKGRTTPRAVRSHLEAERSQQDPHRIVAMTITFTVEGDVPADAVGRAIALSHNKYCSVWHSMREDITFTTKYDVLP